ncbi:MAG TPA: hypothetical protein VFD70_27870 [Anaerolineae bacterium]|nr:hypothetical protein [Anaerolineae bacterium]
MDLPTAPVLFIALGVILLWLDALFFGGAMMGGMVHGAARLMGSPFGWTLIVALVIFILIVFGLVFASR